MVLNMNAKQAWGVIAAGVFAYGLFSGAQPCVAA
jgi:hypothetical protein